MFVMLVGWFSRADLQGVWGGVAAEGLGPLLEGTTQEHRHVAQPLPGLSQGHVTRAQFNTLSLPPPPSLSLSLYTCHCASTLYANIIILFLIFQWESKQFD